MKHSYIKLYWYRSRWYDYELGHFIQPDSILPGAGNTKAYDRYAYAEWNPIRYSNPSGHRVCEGTVNCDPLPKSSLTKAYYQDQLKNQYDWNVGDEFSYQETKYLYEIGGDMRLFFSNETSGHGKTWMEKNVGEINFLKGTPAHQAISFLNQASTSFVLYMNTIHFADEFMKWGKGHVVHEITHIIDNKMAGGKLATYHGDGPADELVKFQRGNPSGIRFRNNSLSLPDPNLLFKSPVKYGNNSSTGYFAEYGGDDV